MMMPLSLIIYINFIQKERYNKLYYTLFGATMLNFVLWTVLHFTGVIDFQSALVYIDSVLGVVILCVIITLALDIRNGHIRDYLYTAF